MSIKKILLVSDKQIKAQSIVEHNVDSKVLSQVTLNVQEVQLKPVLGKALYESVLNEVNETVTNATPIASPTKEMLDDYVIPFLVFAVLADFIVINNFKLSNKGLMKVTDNSAQSATPQDLEYVKNYYDNYLSHYKGALIEYLKSNNLTEEYNTDTDIASGSIGWFLD